MAVTYWKDESGETLQDFSKRVQNSLGEVTSIIIIDSEITDTDKIITIKAAIIYTPRAITKQFE